MRDRIVFLDALRGYAILLVIIAHSTTHFILTGAIPINDIPSKLLYIFWNGGLGVTLFFIVSAFTLTYIYSNKLELKKFYIKRFFRIAPLYYLGIIIYGFFVYQIKLPNDLFKLLTNLTFIHGLSSVWNNSVVPGGWSIGNEFLFYFIFPLLIKYLNSLNKLVTFLCVSIILAKITQILLHRYLPGDDSLLRENFILFLPTFALGILSCKIVFGDKEKLNLINVSLIIMIIAVHLVNGFLIYKDTIFSAICATMLVFLAKGYLNFLVIKPLIYLGELSYSLYLTHFIVLHAVEYFNLVSPFNNLYIDMLYRLVVVLGVSICLSRLTFKYVETKMITVGNKLATNIS